MGCTTCGSGGAVVQSARRVQSTGYQNQIIDPNCEYNDVLLLDFRKRLTWFKNKALYIKNNISAATINRYLGIVITSMNINNKCAYREQLAEISNIVNLIISIQDA